MRQQLNGLACSTRKQTTPCHQGRGPITFVPRHTPTPEDVSRSLLWLSD
jgi:hypothetical protein